MAQALTGGCLCGAVRYKVSGDQIFSGRCYCNDCRKTSGTGHNAVLAVAEQGVCVPDLAHLQRRADQAG